MLWRTAVVDGKSYAVYYSAPDQDFETKRAMYDEIAKSYRFSNN